MSNHSLAVLFKSLSVNHSVPDRNVILSSVIWLDLTVRPFLCPQTFYFRFCSQYCSDLLLLDSVSFINFRSRIILCSVALIGLISGFDLLPVTLFMIWIISIITVFWNYDPVYGHLLCFWIFYSTLIFACKTPAPICAFCLTLLKENKDCFVFIVVFAFGSSSATPNNKGFFSWHKFQDCHLEKIKWLLYRWTLLATGIILVSSER